MTHRPAVFAALLGLIRAGSAIGDFWVQSDFCARVNGASDDHPVTFTDPVTAKETTHGTADGRKACLHHVASVGLVTQEPSPRQASVLVKASKIGATVVDRCRAWNTRSWARTDRGRHRG
ncbi:hypothetical protein [Streptomyces subrutilus]|uniref:hypothetical protein n=1 Tax=Streptomyces subrutilus TaxID=36818 RepID=UPI001FCA62F2|nr:hypothetical protein [Streptomyces subrutilus]